MQEYAHLIPSHDRTDGRTNSAFMAVRRTRPSSAGPSFLPPNPTREEAPATRPEQKRTWPHNGMPDIGAWPPKTTREVIPVPPRVPNPNIRVAIILDAYPCNLIDEVQGERIRSALLDQIDQIPDGGPSPRFSESRCNGGVVYVTCADAASRQWLEGAIRGCEPSCGAKLAVIDAKDTIRPVKAMTWIPGPVAETQRVLRRLEIQNSGLRTNNWKVMSRRVEPRGQQLFIVMDEASWAKIQRCGCKPYLNFTRVTFEALGSREEKERKVCCVGSHQGTSRW